MKPIKIQNATRSLQGPKDWDGDCEVLDIYDFDDENGNVMVSAWIPEEEELEAIQNGAVVYLHIYGKQHPVVGLAIQGM